MCLEMLSLEVGPGDGLEKIFEKGGQWRKHIWKVTVLSSWEWRNHEGDSRKSYITALKGQ